MQESLGQSRYLGLGVFVAATLFSATVGVFAIGRHGGLFAQTFTLRAAFPAIGGVQEGTRVRVQGIDAGVVTKIGLPATPGDPVVLDLELDRRFQGLVRRDGRAQLATQGMIGQRVVEISPGTSGAAAAESGDSILAEPPIELSQLLAQAQQAGDELRKMGTKLGGAIDRVDRLAARVEEGQGSVGKFVMTDDAHRAALELMQSTDHLMTSLDETTAAARRSWLLRDYFVNQGMAQPDELLFRPGHTRDARHFKVDELFKPGTSVLSDSGRAKLDEAAAWLGTVNNSKSEIVVAAFEQAEPANLRAQRLTQEQATAVRTYLVDQHSVHKTGLFARRTVVAAGFGNSKAGNEDAKTPPNRVEIVLFVPVE